MSLVAVVAGVAFAASLSAGGAGASLKYKEYPRAQSLVTFGTQYGDFQGFNPFTDAYATGTVELCNETLLRYDPLKDRYINWLARSARFTANRVYTVKVRPGVKWSNGQPFTGADVAFNIKLGRFSTAFWHDLYGSLKSIKAKGLTVTFTFKNTPNYVQWQHLVWNLPMANPRQARTIKSSASLTAYDPSDPIGTGPYKLDIAGYDQAVRVVWRKKADWWAAAQKIAPSPKPTYIVGLNNSLNVNALAALLIGSEDLTNNYLPGIENSVKQGKAQTYYSAPPYHLSRSTAWLTPNVTHKPLSDPVFRKALATAINVKKIVATDYGNLVLRASPTGLLPIWKKWIDNSLVSSKGFSYGTTRAVAMLRGAGYPESGGYFRNKDGSAIDLTIEVPTGWSDWESAETIIVSSADAAHIKIHAVEGDYDAYERDLTRGTFDLVIDSSAEMSDNPWTYFDFLFHLPIHSSQTSANFSRYSNVRAWSLVEKLAKTPPGKTTARKSIMNQLEKTVLTDVPNIPLWYSGIWAQSQSKYWTNWPSSTSKRNYLPCMWRGYMQMTGIDMITHLEPS
jgi:peptide/nickel transport system substrate-binding protein